VKNRTTPGEPIQVNVSVIATVLNEKDSIQPFLKGLLSQTRSPSEIVIVDGGSIDGTIEYIKAIASANPVIRLLVEKGCNVARGRNIAIQYAQSEYVAMTDAGSTVDAHWLERLMAPLENDPGVDIVGGWVEMNPKTAFERWVSLLHRPYEKIALGKFLPSARSLAMKKSCWKEVNGFPEDLSMWAEDTVFLQRIKKKNFRLVVAPKAIVRWRPRHNLDEFLKQYFEYGIGDGEARIYPGLYLKRFGLFLSVIMFFVGMAIDSVIPILCFMVLMMAFIQVMLPLKSPSVPFWKLFPLFSLVLLKEAAQTAGYCIGRARRKTPSS
jgi:glycosyltransferase involved in cell wall biosynthesis